MRETFAAACCCQHASDIRRYAAADFAAAATREQRRYGAAAVLMLPLICVARLFCQRCAAAAALRATLCRRLSCHDRVTFRCTLPRIDVTPIA